MKPHRNNNNIMPIIEIDDDIIDLDGQEKTPEEVVYEWDAKIRKQITEYSIAANENILVEFMKEYLKSSEDMARNYEDNDSFRRKVLCHASFFYSYFTELKCCMTDNYLDIMEDILSLYCNLELKVIRLLKRKDSNKREYKRRIAAVCRRIIHVLTVYLLEKSDHMLHVLIKLNNNHNSESCIKILNVLYRHFLTEVPVTSMNDESFCRTYILFQKWKQIRKTEEWQEMDETMYKMYKRNADSIRTNDTLKRLLMPTCQSTVDVLLQLFRPVRDISDAYFKHIKEKKNIDIDYIDFRIDLGEDDLNLSVNDNKEDESENDEVEFMRAYQEVEQNMSTLIRNSDSNKNVDFILQTKVKHEHEDDDCEFIGYSFLPPVQQQQKQLFVADEDSQNSNNLNSNNNNNNNRVKEKSSSSPTVQSKSVEVSTDIESTLATSALPPPPQTTTAAKVCSVSTSTENFPDSNTISDDSCVINNNNNNNNTIVNNNNNNDNIGGRKTVSTRTVETQSEEQTINKNCLYSYGLVTPPSDLPIDDHNSRTVETTCVYTDIMPTNPNIHDGNIRSSIDEDEEECISEENQAIIEHQTNVQQSEDIIEDYREKTLTKPVELDKFDHSKTIAIDDEIKVNKNDQIHERLQFTTETTTTNPIQSKIIDNHEVDGIVTNPPSNHLQSHTNEAVYNHFDDREVPDTGQIKETPNIVCNDDISDGKNCNINNKSKDNSTTLSQTLEPVNGNTLLKPLNSTTTQNGHNNKILFTSTQTIRNTATLEEFSKFEESLNWKKTHHTDFDDVLSGPISKISLNKNHQLINDAKLDFFNTNSDVLQTKTNLNNRQQQQQHVVDNNSRSNSPNEMLSPAFETIDDFRIQDFYNNDGQINVNGGINRLSTNITTTTTAPPLISPSLPPEHGILKKTHLGVTLKKKPQISFGENTFYNFYSDEKRTRSTTTTPVRDLFKTDKKLQMELRVNLQRLPFIENSVKKVVESARTIRVDYDKSTPYINKNDVVRCVSPPTLSWTYRSFDSVKERLNPGSTTVKNRDHLEKKPKKRKSEAPLTLNNPTGVPRKRGRPRKYPLQQPQQQ